MYNDSNLKLGKPTLKHLKLKYGEGFLISTVTDTATPSIKENTIRYLILATLFILERPILRNPFTLNEETIQLSVQHYKKIFYKFFIQNL